MSTQIGWLCPRCEVVHAPFVVRCNCEAKSLADRVKPNGNPKKNDSPASIADVVERTRHRGAPRMT